MVKSITPVTNLPDWFSLDKYASSIDFQLTDWLNAFSFRYYLFLLQDCLSDGSSSDPQVIDEIMMDQIAALKNIKNNGALAHEANNHRVDAKRFVSSVTSIDVYEAFLIAENLSSDETGKNNSAHKNAYDVFEAELRSPENENILISSPSMLMESAHDVMDPDTFPLHQVAFAKVDLNTPNSIILQNFEKWLREVKKTHRHLTVIRERKFSDLDSRKWFQSSVLPYLDLMYWQKVEGIEISRRLIENAIFPIDRQINVTEVLKATTVPLAEKILSGDIVRSLEADLGGRGASDVK